LDSGRAARATLYGECTKTCLPEYPARPHARGAAPARTVGVICDTQVAVEEDVPGIISVLSDIPEAPRGYEFRVVRRDDGRYT
jgi:hypothetical protein